MDGYALWCPGLGWFACRDGDNAADVFSTNLRDACIFRNEDEAVSYSVALTERHLESIWWIYAVSLLRRRLRGGR